MEYCETKAEEKGLIRPPELLEIYAQREARVGYAFANQMINMKLFSSGFPFGGNADQQMAIEAVMQDMSSRKPMDRLPCVAMWFRLKQEVAMRAPFGRSRCKQVAVLVPLRFLVDIMRIFVIACRLAVGNRTYLSAFVLQTVQRVH